MVISGKYILTNKLLILLKLTEVDKMVLTEKQEKTLKKMPIVESRLRKSQDGKFLVHQTIITDLKPVGYYETVIERESEVEAEAQ